MLWINGVRMPNPSEYIWSEQDLSSEASGRNLAGEMLKDVVSRKVKLEFTWPPLSPADASKLLTAATSKIYLQIKYADPKSGGYTTKTMYVGDRTAPLLKYDNTTGAQYWEGIAFNFIEK